MYPSQPSQFITLTPRDKDIDPHPHHINVNWIKQYWKDAEGRGTWLHLLGNGRSHKLIINAEELYTESVDEVKEKIEQLNNR